MADTLADKLAPYGIDYVDAMDRFGDAADLYKSMALKYLENTNYVSFVAAMEVGDAPGAYKAAHSLKGVAGNLSFKNLFECAKLVSDALFAGEFDAAKFHMPEVERAQKQVLEGLEKWENDEL